MFTEEQTRRLVVGVPLPPRPPMGKMEYVLPSLPMWPNLWAGQKEVHALDGVDFSLSTEELYRCREEYPIRKTMHPVKDNKLVVATMVDGYRAVLSKQAKYYLPNDWNPVIGNEEEVARIVRTLVTCCINSMYGWLAFRRGNVRVTSEDPSYFLQAFGLDKLDSDTKYRHVYRGKFAEQALISCATIKSQALEKLTEYRSLAGNGFIPLDEEEHARLISEALDAKTKLEQHYADKIKNGCWVWKNPAVGAKL